MSGKYKSKGLDELANLKNFMNGNFIEIIKPAIKQKSNESVMKMMDIIKDKPEYWFEFISIAIFHQNFPIMKHMIEAFDITPHQMPLLNPISMSLDILNSDTSKQKQTENKESYLDVECPLIVQAAMGGDIDIFKYLLDNGFGENMNIIGHIALSRKYKNSIITNCIGAAAYYGKERLLQYILEHYERKLDMNFKTIEKKAKVKHSTLIRECSDYTPIHLAIASETNQEKTIEIMKHLDGYKAIVNEYDFKGNSVLHIAAQYNKLMVVKYIIEELHLDNFSKESNKEGQTPMGIAQMNKGEAICDYLRNNTEQLDEKIEEDLKELMETQVKKKKGKKKKKNNVNNEPGLLNSTEYQETIKIEEKQQQKDIKTPEKEEVIIENIVEESSNQVSEIKNNATVINNTPVEKYNEKKEYYNEENRNEYQKPAKKQNKQKNKDNHDYDYDYNYDGYNYDYNSYDYGNYHQNKQGGNYNRKNYPQQRGGYNYNNDYEYGNKKYQNNNNNNQQKESNSANTKKYYLQEIPSEKPKEKPIVEPKEEILKVEVEPESKHIKEVIKAPEEIPQHHDEVEDFEDEDEEEDFLEEDKDEPQQPSLVQCQSKQQQSNIEEKVQYNQLIDKYNQLEQQYQLIQKEKLQLESFIKATQSQQPSISTRTTLSLSSSEENINDLLELANDELAQKNKEIAILQKKVEMTDLSNIKNYSLAKLNKIKEFYDANIKLVHDAIYSLDK